MFLEPDEEKGVIQPEIITKRELSRHITPDWVVVPITFFLMSTNIFFRIDNFRFFKIISFNVSFGCQKISM